MQEGILSLMQMAKTSAWLARFADEGLLYVSILTHPTTGGVTASFAMLGDIIIAEPGALVGFAGPRVIEQTINQELPKGFQRAEFLLDHGMVDMVTPRPKMKKTLIDLFDFFGDIEKPIEEKRKPAILKTPPHIVGTVKALLEDGRVVVRSTTGPDFIVFAADFIEKKELKIGSRVALNKQSLSVISVLPGLSVNC